MASITIELDNVSRMDDLLRFAELLHLLGCNEDHPVKVHAGSACISARVGTATVELPVVLDFIKIEDETEEESAERVTPE